MSKLGKTIVLEGVDGAGKATQYQKLWNRLSSEHPNLHKLGASFPNYDAPQSTIVKMYLGNNISGGLDSISAYQASPFYTVDRFITYRNDLKQHHEEGSLLLLDRWTTSNIIYQAAKIDNIEAQKQFIDWLENFEYEIYKLPKPSAVFLLYLPPEIQQSSLKSRTEKKGNISVDIHEADLKYQIKTAETALFCAEYLGWNIINRLDNNGSEKTIDQIHEEIYEKTKLVLELK